MVVNQEAAPSVASEPGEEYALPATVAQQAFWYLDGLRPGNPAYNISIRFRIAGPLQPAVLERALAEVVGRHETLRTTFIVNDGELLQLVTPPGPVSFLLDDLRHDANPGRGEALATEEASRVFDLESGPLFRARLLRLTDAEYVLLLTVHHIVADGWSTGLIIDELAVLYAAFAAGQPSPLTAPAIQYGDFAVWQAEMLRTPAVATQLDYWKKQLAAIEPLFVPHDKELAPGTPARGQIESILLPRDLTDQLTLLSHRHGVTLFPMCLTCLKLLLSFRTSREDVAVGTLVVGRPRTELETVVGLFVNTLVLRTDLSGDPMFLELLDRVRQTVTEAMDNQDVPFGRVIEGVSVRRQKGRQPLFGVNFLFQTAFLKPTQVGGVTITPIPSLSPGATLDLNVFMVERQEGWRASCEYCPDEYDPETIRRLLRDFQRILEGAASDPSRRISTFRLPDFTPQPASSIPSGDNGRPEPHPDPNARRIAPPTVETQTDLKIPDLSGDEVENRLTEIWRQVLQGQEFGVTDNFFDLGGHSLMAARLVAKIHERFGVRLSPAVLHEHSTVRQLAQVLKRAGSLDKGGEAAPDRLHPRVPHSNGHGSWNGAAAHSLLTRESSATSPAGRRETPFFFPSPEGQLFGVYAPPVDRDRGEGVVLCAPPGHEYMATHNCLRLLAMELSRAGFHVLRFDYSCLGNSWGAFEQASTSRWVRDVGVAIRELSERSGTSTISLVGLRLGAALAYQAADDARVKQLVLWDPVANGREYMDRLRRLQDRTHTAGTATPAGTTEELLGYFYSANLVTDLERLDLTATEPRCDHIGLVLSEETPGAASLREYLTLRNTRPAVQLVPTRSGWDDDTYTLSLTLHQARRAVVDLLKRATS